MQKSIRIWGAYRCQPGDEGEEIPKRLLPVDGTKRWNPDVYRLLEHAWTDPNENGYIGGGGHLNNECSKRGTGWRLDRMGVVVTTTSEYLFGLALRYGALNLFVGDQPATEPGGYNLSLFLDPLLGEPFDGSPENRHPLQAELRNKLSRAIVMPQPILIPPRQVIDLNLRICTPLLKALIENEQSLEHYFELRGYLLGRTEVSHD